MAERMGAELRATPAEMNHAIAERLRRTHGVTVAVGPIGNTLRRYDAALRRLDLSESLPRESRGFQMAFQLMLLEARDAVEAVAAPAEPSTSEAAALIRLGLLNYTAAALLMPYAPFLHAARELRHEVEALAARFGVSFEQVAHRLATLQRDGARGVPFFFLRVDPAGNVDKRFSAAGFPFARFGGSCPKWIVHRAFGHPGTTQVQVAQLPDGATFLTVARAIAAPTTRWGEPAPTHVVAMGCDISRASEIAYADGLNLATAAVGIGLSCRLCDRADCRSRAFPPLEHRLKLDPNEDSAAPWRFETKMPRA
ncbi:short-chain fatty acyl-CoA regulator family protein [Leptolyngbya sp. 15MV]|nr:short-chain fatty acyl-CoA regulator family protein [Leptolyngbya sp. 15MV]